MVERLPSMHEVQYSKQKETQLERDGEGEWWRREKKKRSLRGKERNYLFQPLLLSIFSTVPLGGAHKQLYSVQTSGKLDVSEAGWKWKPPTEKDQRAKQPY